MAPQVPADVVQRVRRWSVGVRSRIVEVRSSRGPVSRRGWWRRPVVWARVSAGKFASVRGAVWPLHVCTCSACPCQQGCERGQDGPRLVGSWAVYSARNAQER